MRVISGILLLLALLGAALAGCGSGNRLDLPEGGGGQDMDATFPVLFADREPIQLTAGVFPTGTDITLADREDDPSNATDVPAAAVTVFGGSHVASAEQIYDTNADGEMDYIILTIRALSAQAMGCVEAYAEGSDPADLTQPGALLPTSIRKIGGATFLPHDAVFTSHDVKIQLYVNPTFASETLAVYRFYNRYLEEFGRTSSDDIGSATGYWVHDNYATDSLTNNGDNTFSFNAWYFGEYCIAFEHDQGSGASI